MKAVVVTVAGISSRFNEGLKESEKVLKAIYTDDSERHTLLYHLLDKCKEMDCMIVVGGYQFESLQFFIKNKLPKSIEKKVILIDNSHYTDMSSGYSLYLGIEEALKFYNLEELLFVEGDLDVDGESFQKVRKEKGTVLTYNYEPIYSDKAVVFYRKADGSYRYSFNSSHGFLKINDSFSSILNSGQVWKFGNMDALKKAAEFFYVNDREGTNLSIVQNYLDRIPQEEIKLVGLKRWTNCNTKEDYKRIKTYWEENRENVTGKIGESRKAYKK